MNTRTAPDLGVRWTYEGTMLGDYPSIDELLRRTRLVMSQALVRVGDR